ncbi:hypothetical protein TOPH_06608 [Tolypocladium ophioglossoides CBS 100239]|uniref:Uncharacterized protein n=1 Tax=Tolypocladium ophioglossoides (strain CBS 100239) TaxID=1163406 RepID=A0A0L0N3U7_TOLOC|nr:hypothetical protein TOPH_06608 [Tolypocladium ophioglossoides CBS 100239]
MANKGDEPPPAYGAPPQAPRPAYGAGSPGPYQQNQQGQQGFYPRGQQNYYQQPQPQQQQQGYYQPGPQMGYYNQQQSGPYPAGQGPYPPQGYYGPQGQYPPGPGYAPQERQQRNPGLLEGLLAGLAVIWNGIHEIEKFCEHAPATDGGVLITRESSGKVVGEGLRWWSLARLIGGNTLFGSQRALFLGRLRTVGS